MTAGWLSEVIGPAESVIVDDIGSDFGFGGTTYLATATLVAGERRRLVVKFATAERTQREITFYEACAPSTPINTPGFIGGSTEGDRGVVILEYLPMMRQGDVLAGCSSTEFLSLARILGRLHGRWWGAADEALGGWCETPYRSGARNEAPGQQVRRFGGSLFHSTLLDDLRTPMPTPTLIDGRADVALERYGHTADESLVERISTLGERLGAIEHTLLSGPMTLIHRDFQLDNILFDAGGTPFVLDWQGAVVGPPTIDLARIFVDCRPPDLNPNLFAAALLQYSAGLEEGPDVTLPRLRDGVRMALERSLAFTVNSLGRVPAADPGTRMQALEAGTLASMGSAFEGLSRAAL